MRLHLNLYRGETLIPDLEGAEYANLEEAYAEAVTSAREIMANRLRHGKEPFRASFSIVDSDGITVAILPFQQAIPVDG